VLASSKRIVLFMMTSRVKRRKRRVIRLMRDAC